MITCMLRFKKVGSFVGLWDDYGLVMTEKYDNIDDNIL